LANVPLGHVWQGDHSDEYVFGIPALLTNQENGGAILHQDREAGFHNNGQRIGSELSCGAADTFILTTNSGSTENARSLVLMIEYRDFTAIFPGDATGVTESQARANFNNNVHATVLSGSHHGAKTHSSNSQSWANETSPNVMIYNSGTQHGHPWCIATEQYESTLSQAQLHNMQCRTSTTYSERRQFTTTRAEYTTEVSGKIVVITNGQSPLHLRCEDAMGCDLEIQY
jgi:beta-lactamase superfamily II metal-dependent hydrolase